MLQTDAAINPGINTFIREGGQNMGFAINIEDILHVLEKLTTSR